MEVASSTKYAISLLPEAAVSSLLSGLKVRSETQLDEVILTVEKSDYRALCERLFAAGFDFPSSMTGVDMEWGLGVVLHVQQLESKRKVAVRTYVTYDAPTLPTVSDMWGGVDWHEREAYDLVGITFAGHHDHRRILLEDHWTIHPLQRKYNTRGYVIPTWSAKPWPSPAPHEEGFVAFGAAAAPVAHAPAAPKAVAAPVASSEVAPVAASSVAAPVISSETAPVVSSDAPATEAPKKAAKKWVPKTVEAAPSSDAVVSSAPPAELAPVVPDDLKRIEGIGPKISDALVAAGIDTFAKLSATTETPLRTALEAAGLSFAPSMSSWAEQARLLANGDTAGFEALKASLEAGRAAAPSSVAEVTAPVETPAAEVPVAETAAAETPAETKPRSPKIKRWEPNG